MKFLNFVLFGLLILCLPFSLMLGQTKDDSLKIKTLQERIDQLNREKQELNLKRLEENLDIKLQTQKEELILRTDNIDSRINSYLGIGGFLILIISIVGLRTIGKWVKQTIENQARNKVEELEKTFDERAKALIDKKLEELTKGILEIEEFTNDLKAIRNQLKTKNIIIDETLNEETVKILREKLEGIKQDSRYFYEDWLYKGVAEHGVGKYREAIKSFNKAIEKKKGMPEAYSRKGLAYYKLEEYDNALECLAKALEIDPDYAFAHNAKGLVYLQLGDYDEAIKCHTKAIELDHSAKWPFENRGYAYLHRREYDKAIKDFNEALKKDNKFLNAYRDRGLAYEMLKQYDKAEEDLKEAIKINPRSIKSFEILSKIQIAKQEYKVALETIRNANELLTDGEERVILYYLNCIVRKILKDESANAEEKFKRVVSKTNSLPRYFVITMGSIENWLKESSLEDQETKRFVAEKTNILKKIINMNELVLQR